MRVRTWRWGVGAALAAVACAKVPVTDRPQYNLIPEALMKMLGKSSYAQALQGADVERKTEDAQLLNQVGAKIAKVANQPDYDWDYTLIEDSEINAWCLPGGYIGFYTGILPVLKHEAGMAFVMGHEVGHAVARHGAERLTQQLTLFGGLAGLSVVLEKETELSAEQRAIVLGALGAGAEVGVVLPFSRMHESEADVIGAMYMARAGYPPEESIPIWDRMSRQTGGGGVPAFLSTHPSDDKRQENLREWMPQAKKRYERNKLSYDTTNARW
jgi:metalloendopeptidase OMA1, mitochondrial